MYIAIWKKKFACQFSNEKILVFAEIGALKIVGNAFVVFTTKLTQTERLFF